MGDRSHLAFTLLGDALKQTSQEVSLLALILTTLVVFWLMGWRCQLEIWTNFSPGRELHRPVRISKRVANVKHC